MKVHLLSTPEPQAITGDMLADCGAIVPRSKELCKWDEQGMGVKLEIPKGVCRKCFKAEKSERYTYAICDERELRTEEELYV